MKCYNTWGYQILKLSDLLQLHDAKFYQTRIDLLRTYNPTLPPKHPKLSIGEQALINILHAQYIGEYWQRIVQKTIEELSLVNGPVGRKMETLELLEALYAIKVPLTDERHKELLKRAWALEERDDAVYVLPTKYSRPSKPEKIRRPKRNRRDVGPPRVEQTAHVPSYTRLVYPHLTEQEQRLVDIVQIKRQYNRRVKEAKSLFHRAIWPRLENKSYSNVQQKEREFVYGLVGPIPALPRYIYYNDMHLKIAISKLSNRDFIPY